MLFSAYRSELPQHILALLPTPEVEINSSVSEVILTVTQVAESRVPGGAIFEEEHDNIFGLIISTLKNLEAELCFLDHRHVVRCFSKCKKERLDQV